MLQLGAQGFLSFEAAVSLLHVDTTWKFKEMIAFRDQTVKRLGWSCLFIPTRKDWRAVYLPLSQGRLSIRK